MKTKTSGKFYQLPDKTWMVDTKVKIGDNYKHLSKKGYKTLREAQNDYERLKSEFIKRNTKTHEVMFFEDLLAKYIELRKTQIRATTLYIEQRMIDTYILKDFKGKLIKDVLQLNIIKDWYLKIMNSDLVEPCKNRLVANMKYILKFAYQSEFISAEPYQKCDIFLTPVSIVRKPKEKVVWTEEQEKIFLDYLKDNNYGDYVLFSIALHTGLRVGELLGLQGKSFNSEKRKLTISQQVVFEKTKGSVLTNNLKTSNSYRTVVLSEKDNELLKEYVSYFNIKDNEFLFFSRDDKTQPYTRTGIFYKLTVYTKRLGIPRISAHSLRHSQAIKLSKVAKNAHEIEIAAKRLGHTPEMFINLYANHTEEEMQNEMLDKMNKE